VTSVFLQTLRTFMMVILLAGVVSACGRRGPLEPPPDPSAPKVEQGDKNKIKSKDKGKNKEKPQEKSQVSSDDKKESSSVSIKAPSPDDDDDDDDDGEITSPVGQAKKRPRHFVIPKEPFILDPLL
jgi:predicted small lipoprotein YifL